jgi:hypothetical protein
MNHRLELPTGLALIGASSLAQWMTTHGLTALHVLALVVGIACSLIGAASSGLKIVDWLDERRARRATSHSSSSIERNR